MKKILILSVLCYFASELNGQNNPPWERPLKIAWSSDGTTFYNESIFQDSSGVPSVIRWKGDTMVCVFQWFRGPSGAATWDRVAVKFSYDNGISWTVPVPIIINGLPGNYQRPFDPTLARLNSDSLRIYFSSSYGMPLMGLDSSVNTYSALSTDGINFNFEPGARFDHPTNKVIDPAVLFFNGLWHYTCPAGAPQDGAYHNSSVDGIIFIPQPDIPSDPAHNWTGNLAYESNTLMKFYGSGVHIWHNSTPDGFNWTGYQSTNLTGGDASCVKISPNSYFIIFVGPPYTTGTIESNQFLPITIYYDSVTEVVYVKNLLIGKCSYTIYDLAGKIVMNGFYLNNNPLSISSLKSGTYLLELPDQTSNPKSFRFNKL